MSRPAAWPDSSPAVRPAAHATLPPAPAAYLGVFEPGAPPDYGVIASFAQAAGRQPNLVGYYSGWAEPFDTSFAETIHEHGVIPFVQIDPTDASISAIAAGTYDDYLAHMPTASAISATPWSSASGTR